MVQPTSSRRRFLAASSNLASAGWISLHWPQIAAAAEHAGHATHAGHAAKDKSAPPTTFGTLGADEAAVVDAIANQIVPAGRT